MKAERDWRESERVCNEQLDLLYSETLHTMWRGFDSTAVELYQNDVQLRVEELRRSDEPSETLGKRLKEFSTKTKGVFRDLTDGRYARRIRWGFARTGIHVRLMLGRGVRNAPYNAGAVVVGNGNA